MECHSFVQYATASRGGVGTRNDAIWGAMTLAASSLQRSGPGRVVGVPMQCNLTRIE